MSNEMLHRLALRAGLLVDWIDAADEPKRVSDESLRKILRALDFDCETEKDAARSLQNFSAEAAHPGLITGEVDAPIALPGVSKDIVRLVLEDETRHDVRLDTVSGAPTLRISQPGYHKLELNDRAIKLAVAPQRCWTLEDVGRGRKLWGLAVQLYGLKRPADGGIGDTIALSMLGKSAAAHGADAIAISPAHALFAARPDKFSPYAPSNRLLLNPLLAGVDELLGGRSLGLDSANDQTSPLIDWPAATARKMTFLRKLFEDFSRRDDELVRDFRAFRQTSGDLLESHARFEAIHAHIAADDPANSGWRAWPREFSSPDKPAVAAFAADHAHEVAFHAFLQWLADRAFGRAQADLREAGMRIGLIADLAVGMESGGSYVWAHQHETLSPLTVGAPPDLFNFQGQNWGLTTFSPRALLEHDFEPFLATLRTAMRHAGGIRIDHILGLKRLWVVPDGAPASEGAYLTYPFEDMLRLIRLESARQRAIVIGEDLGTVPEGFRDALAENGIAGMDVLWFAQDKKGFLDPGEWRHDAVAMTATHDLPTVAGWWRGADIEFRADQGLTQDAGGEKITRSAERKDLWRVFTAADITSAPLPSPETPSAVVDDAIAFAASSPSPLVLLPLEDLLGLEAQPNVPGTIDEHPNWRRRYPVDAKAIFDAPQVAARAEILSDRGKA